MEHKRNKIREAIDQVFDVDRFTAPFASIDMTYAPDFVGISINTRDVYGTD